MAKNRINNSNYANRDSRIVSTKNSRNTVTTKTKGRDNGTLNVEVTSKQGGNGQTRLFIKDGDGSFLGLNGFEARTVYNALAEHYATVGRTY